MMNESGYELYIEDFNRKMQCLRAIACIFICFNHTQFFNSRGYGEIGVEIFFILSGYLTVYNADKKGRLRKGYLLDKLKKIIVMYWIITLLFYFVGLVLPQVARGIEFSFNNLISSMLLIPGHTYLLYQGWTLTYMFMFYVIFWISDKISLKYRSAIAIIIILIVVLNGRINASFNNIDILIAYCNPVLLEFGYGIILFYILKFLSRYISNKSSKNATFIATMLIILMFFKDKDIFGRRYFAPALITCIAIGLFSFCHISSKILMYGTCIGKYSFTVYILHPLLLRPIDKILVKLFDGDSWVYFIFVIFGVALTIAISMIFQESNKKIKKYILHHNSKALK